MKRRLLFAMSAAALAATVGVGATFALFTATERDEQTLVAGTLCLTSERNDGDRVPGPMFYVTPEQGQTDAGLPGLKATGVWAPGDTLTRTLTVYNPVSCSSLDAWLTGVQASLRSGSYKAMADKLWVEIYTPHPLSNSEEKVGEGWLSQFLAGEVPIAYSDGSKVPMVLSSNRHMKFKVTFDRSADNKYQDKTLVVDFIVNAEQMRNNP